jgi:hypothetical protein
VTSLRGLERAPLFLPEVITVELKLVLRLLTFIALLTTACEATTQPRGASATESNFEPNRGQFVPEALYVWRGKNWQIEFQERAILFRGSGSRPLSLEFVNPSPKIAVIPEDQSGEVTNYIIGQDASRWISVRGYRRLVYRDTYPGVSLSFHSGRHGPEFDLILSPGANPTTVRWQVRDGARVRKDGSLRLGSADKKVLLKAPLAYQETSEGQQRIPCSYVILPRRQLGLWVGTYDREKPLIIDPEIDFSSYFGGSSQNIAGAAAYDSQGNLVFVGSTSSSDYPTINPLQPYRGNGTLGSNVVVTKLNPTGTQVLFSTYLGGTTNGVSASAVSVDNNGNIYITGSTDSSDFPTTAGAFQSHPKTTICKSGGSSGACRHAFVAKIDPVLGQLSYSTYLSGSQTDAGSGIAVNTSGNAYVGGYTYSADFPVVSGFQPEFGGGTEDGFVSMLSPDGSSLVASTYLGGSSGDSVFGLSLDPSGNVVVAGGTASNNFPVAQPFQQSLAGKSDGFITVLSPQMDAVRFSSLFGGTDSDFVTGVTVDGAGNIYLGGSTLSRDFPVTSGAVQMNFGGADNAGLGDGFIAKIDGIKHSLSYSSYIGGSAGEEVHAVGADLTGNTTVFFTTSSQNLPVVNALQNSLPSGGFFHSYLATFRPDGKALSFATYLGGNGEDAATALAVTPCGAVTPFLGTTSTNLPIVSGLYQNPPSPYSSIYFSEIGGGKDFAIAAYPDAIALTRNSSANATLSLRPCGGFMSTVQLSCSGAPAGVSCTIATPSIELKANQNIQLTITSKASAKANHHMFESIFAVVFGTVFVLPLRRRRHRALSITRLFAFMAVVACLGMASCGGGSTKPPSSPGNPGNGTITITASSGSVVHTTQISLETQ